MKHLYHFFHYITLLKILQVESLINSELLVPVEGVEPSRLSTQAFETCVPTITPHGHWLREVELHHRPLGYEPSKLLLLTPRYNYCSNILSISALISLNFRSCFMD